VRVRVESCNAPIRAAILLPGRGEGAAAQGQTVRQEALAAASRFAHTLYAKCADDAVTLAVISATEAWEATVEAVYADSAPELSASFPRLVPGPGLAIPAIAGARVHLFARWAGGHASGRDLVARVASSCVLRNQGGGSDAASPGHGEEQALAAFRVSADGSLAVIPNSWPVADAPAAASAASGSWGFEPVAWPHVTVPLPAGALLGLPGATAHAWVVLSVLVTPPGGGRPQALGPLLAHSDFMLRPMLVPLAQPMLLSAQQGGHGTSSAAVMVRAPAIVSAESPHDTEAAGRERPSGQAGTPSGGVAAVQHHESAGGAPPPGVPEGETAGPGVGSDHVMGAMGMRPRWRSAPRTDAMLRLYLRLPADARPAAVVRAFVSTSASFGEPGGGAWSDGHSGPSAELTAASPTAIVMMPLVSGGALRSVSAGGFVTGATQVPSPSMLYVALETQDGGLLWNLTVRADVVDALGYLTPTSGTDVLPSQSHEATGSRLLVSWSGSGARAVSAMQVCPGGRCVVRRVCSMARGQQGGAVGLSIGVACDPNRLDEAVPRPRAFLAAPRPRRGGGSSRVSQFGWLGRGGDDGTASPDGGALGLAEEGLRSLGAKVTGFASEAAVGFGEFVVELLIDGLIHLLTGG